MGRASKRNPINDPVVVDEGEPGSYYFPYPQLMEIASKKKPSPPIRQVQTYHGGSSRQGFVPGEGQCRLGSSHKITGYTPPDNLEYSLDRWPKREDADAYFAMWRVQGYSRGAVVCRRHQPLADFDKIYRWGYISFLHSWTSSMPFSPYFVRWFGDGSDAESAWAEDLVIIHAGLDYPMLQGILESQEILIPDRINGVREL